MATTCHDQMQWQKTSVPMKYMDKRYGTWRLRMTYTPSKKLKTKVVQSTKFKSAEEAEEAIHWWRLSWELGQKGVKIDPKTHGDQHSCSTSVANGGSKTANLPQGELKYCIHLLSECSTHETHDVLTPTLGSTSIVAANLN